MANPDSISVHGVKYHQASVSGDVDLEALYVLICADKGLTESPTPARSIRVGGAGDVTVVLAGTKGCATAGYRNVLHSNCQVGEVILGQFTKITLSGTTATLLTIGW